MNCGWSFQFEFLSKLNYWSFNHEGSTKCKYYLNLYSKFVKGAPYRNCTKVTVLYSLIISNWFYDEAGLCSYYLQSSVNTFLSKAILQVKIHQRSKKRFADLILRWLTLILYVETLFCFNQCKYFSVN